MASNDATPSPLDVPAARWRHEERRPSSPLAVTRIASPWVSQSQPKVALTTAMHCGLQIIAKVNHHLAGKAAARVLRIDLMRRTGRTEPKVQLGDRFPLSASGLTKVVADTGDWLVIRLLGHAEAVNHRDEMALARGALSSVSVAASVVANSEAP
jgi:hypothetical protein